MRKTLIFLLFIAAVPLVATAPRPPAKKYEANWASLNRRKMPKWFHHGKFGIFIHWGVYAVPSFAPIIPNSGDSYSEWYWNHYVTTKQKDVVAFHDKNYGAKFPYQQFESMFNASMFEPEEWAKVFKNSGAKYVVLTSKHHEGYCLWNSAEADRAWQRPWNAVTGTPKRDLLGDLTDAVRKSGLRMGYYYSLYEWYNPLWLKNRKHYVNEHVMPQLKDLVKRYKPSIIFSDGEWEMSSEDWKSPEFLAWLFNESPVKNEVVVNDRWGKETRGKNTGATYATSEYGSGMDASVIWEESQGIGHSYGYNRNEQLGDYKTGYNLILRLVDVVSRGGNLLLDIGPTADGRIPVIMQQRLADIGAWLKINGDAIYGTSAIQNHAYQWSAGIKPERKSASYMSAYNVGDLVKPRAKNAHIEAFFTVKNNDLYCILPAYVNEFTLNGLIKKTPVKTALLGCSKLVKLKKETAGYRIYLPAVNPGELAEGPVVIHLKNAL